MDRGEDKLECFAARLWEQHDKLGLDVESLAYGMALHHLALLYNTNPYVQSLVLHLKPAPAPLPAC